MATEAQKEELREKVARLVGTRFGGDYHRAFEHYDNNKKDGKISKGELVEFLKDAGVGNLLTRGAWADGIMAELDADGDGTISGPEFEAALR
jgi:Ca2+-binding EF-hand superfamily protein